jgi:3-hydroxypropanoate dehydrogenase
MHRIVNDEALDTLFRAARSHHAWLARPVSDTILRALWELVKLGPTSGSGRPARILLVRSDAARLRLGPAVAAEERAGLIGAPVAAIVFHPLDRHPGRAPGEDPSDERHAAALRDATLQAAYLIIAARALGLDCAPVWNFDKTLVNAAFFPEGTAAANFLCALGYGEDTEQSPHEERPGFAEACDIL